MRPEIARIFNNILKHGKLLPMSSRTVAALLMQDTTHADSRVTVKREHTVSAEHDGKLASPGGQHAQKKPDK